MEEGNNEKVELWWAEGGEHEAEDSKFRVHLVEFGRQALEEVIEKIEEVGGKAFLGISRVKTALFELKWNSFL